MYKTSTDAGFSEGEAERLTEQVRITVGFTRILTLFLSLHQHGEVFIPCRLTVKRCLGISQLTLIEPSPPSPTSGRLLQRPAQLYLISNDYHTELVTEVGPPIFYLRESRFFFSGEKDSIMFGGNPA